MSATKQVDDPQEFQTFGFSRATEKKYFFFKTDKFGSPSSNKFQIGRNNLQLLVSVMPQTKKKHFLKSDQIGFSSSEVANHLLSIFSKKLIKLRSLMVFF